MPKPDEPVLTGPRWSYACVCPRKCVYGANDAPSTPPDDATLKIFKRGKTWERIIMEEIEENLRAQDIGISRQVPIAWPKDDPVGTGHADAIILDGIHRTIEVVSTAGGALPEQKAIQVAGYTLNTDLADSAIVVSLDTHTGEDHTYPIDLDGLEPRVREIEESVVKSLRDGTLPDRVCTTPLSGPAHMCPFRDTCFEGWEWPPLDELIGDEDTVQALADATDHVAMLKEELKGAQGKVSELRDELSELFPPGVQVQAGGIELRRTEFSRRSFSLGDYEKTGHTLPPDAEEFIRVSPQERWTVRRQPE